VTEAIRESLQLHFEDLQRMPHLAVGFARGGLRPGEALFKSDESPPRSGGSSVTRRV